MTWDTYHRRDEVIRAVIAEADARGDGTLPIEVPGVAETFGDEVALIGALQMRWHTKLAGMIERELMDQPMDLESAVLSAWRRAATDLPGIRAILDAYTGAPTSPDMERATRTAHRKDLALMAAMAGRSNGQDDQAAVVGRALEQKARTVVAA